MENITKKDEITMKLLHYFITEKDYSPVVLHGAKNEIWLENMNSDYKIIRIVSNYIHNNEQLNFDIFKTRRIVKSIKRKTLNVNMNVLSFFIDLGDNVSFHDEKGMDFVRLDDEDDIDKYKFLYDYFPDIKNKMCFTEEGFNLFIKITDDINQKNMVQAEKVDRLFKPKVPYITYALMAINIAIFLFGNVFGASDFLIGLFGNYRPYVLNYGYYRLFTSMFIHADIFHLLFNMYALYILGSQTESFFGKFKFLLIYFISGLAGSLLSVLLNQNSFSIGASGAIFGIMGALLYFGYNYRVYLGNTLVRQLIPVIIINLSFGFMITGIDNYAHIGGVIGGYLIAKAIGFNETNSSNDRINGIIMSLLLFAFLIFMNFFY